ncbi:FecR domain-containing protein [Pseudomonas sp. PDM16]|uniref:FecR domain-containing protein n=1 Tax=Pseudomonas sp. PDM16 TaxID=2769292 RepID=UPI00178123B5|nr:FecR domain-containing protein [Pseudomonas sp. PDM16]MBD9413507.1 FecR domain-containing protein [Pseudomonas sp. PDM16]
MSLADQRLALRDAAQWHAHLGAAPECQTTRQQWQSWHQGSDLNRWAWQRLEHLQAELQGLPGPLARRAVGEAGLPRRTLLKGLVLGVGASGLAWSGYRHSPAWLADVRTGVGERRSLNLEDGTLLTLNTASAVDIRYTESQRLIVLRAGEILVETAKDPRPLSVRSDFGEMRALGTRFSVRQYDGHTELNVLEHAVAVRAEPMPNAVRVDAGMRLNFGSGRPFAPERADPNQAEWRNGRLVIDDWRLDRVLAELQRYRPGFIRCAEDIAHLRVSGAYPLDDTDRALAAIARALPVRIDTRTRFWVSVGRRA